MYDLTCDEALDIAEAIEALGYDCAAGRLTLGISGHYWYEVRVYQAGGLIYFIRSQADFEAFKVSLENARVRKAQEEARQAEEEALLRQRVHDRQRRIEAGTNRWYHNIADLFNGVIPSDNS